jgi:hypothetical protein
MAIIDDTVGKLARVYDSATDTWIPLVGSPVPHVHNLSTSPDVDITEPLADNEILQYSTSASAFVNTDSPTFDVATIDTANIDVANIIQPSTTVKPLIIRSTAPQTAAVTAATASSGSVTYAITSAETIFTDGDLVTISGIDPSSLDDVRATVGSVSSGSVVIFSGKQGTYVSGGTATRIHANLLEIQNSAGTPTSTIRSDGSVTGELTGGLVHIKQQTIGSAVSSVNVTDVFSSIYDNYLILVSGGEGSSNQLITLKIGASTTGYYATGLTTAYNSTSVVALNTSNGSTFPYAGFSSSAGNAAQILLIAPNLAKHTVYQSNAAHNNFTIGQTYPQNGFLNDTTQHTDFTLAVGDTMTGGEINVYGYRK